jgi:hypothetical protein
MPEPLAARFTVKARTLSPSKEPEILQAKEKLRIYPNQLLCKTISLFGATLPFQHPRESCLEAA